MTSAVPVYRTGRAVRLGQRCEERRGRGGGAYCDHSLGISPISWFRARFRNVRLMLAQIGGSEPWKELLDRSRRIREAWSAQRAGSVPVADPAELKPHEEVRAPFGGFHTCWLGRPGPRSKGSGAASWRVSSGPSCAGHVQMWVRSVELKLKGIGQHACVRTAGYHASRASCSWLAGRLDPPRIC